MVYCCIYGCKNCSQNYDKSFHRIPKVISHHGEQTESISKERREKWFTIINRKDMKKDSDNYRVCAEHFVSGTPAKLFFKSHPDWVPTVNLGYPRKPSDLTRFKSNEKSFYNKQRKQWKQWK